MDLMKLDTPNLLLVKSAREDDPKVDQLFIEMVRTFIKNNGLRETISNQIPTIMVINIILQFYFMMASLDFRKINPNHTCNLVYL